MAGRAGVCGAWLLVAVSLAFSGEVGFLEDFALAPDRGKAVAQLVPGTDEHYYYRCLHLQQQGQTDAVAALVRKWIAERPRQPVPPLCEEIRNRQALLQYPEQGKASLEFLRWRLGLHFNHQRQDLDREPDLPSRLDETLISRKRLTAVALRHRGNLDGFEDSALEFLHAHPEGRRRLTALLQRLPRPDYPGLAELVVQELKKRDPRHLRFGSLPVHGKLLQGQLDRCLELLPCLRNQTPFIDTYLLRLLPSEDIDLAQDRDARQQYLERLWSFVKTLPPSQNAYKAHALYHRLDHDRRGGVYDKERFLTYLRLPRRSPLVNPDYLRHKGAAVADLNRRIKATGPLSRIGNEEPLLREYFLHFFRTEESARPYETLVRDTWLRPVFAEARILAGVGTQETWFAMLSPAQVQALKERVDIEFLPTNRIHHAVDEPVTLAVAVKNVPELLVKVYRLNALNIYRETDREISTDLDLDGLVPNEEQRATFDTGPFRRVERAFPFESLSGPGVYVIEFIGNGKSSRAVVRKGRLTCLERLSSAGHVFTLVDEAQRVVTGGAIWLGSHRYAAGADGTVTLPYSTRPGRRSLVLTGAGRVSLASFEHRGEALALDAAFHVDRESLLPRAAAKLLVRARLLVNNQPAPLELLEEVTLVITSTDRLGTETSKTVSDLAFAADRETVVEFQVPENLLALRFGLRAKVERLTDGAKQDLAASHAVALNGIDTTEKTECPFLVRHALGHTVYLLGKSGEARAGQPLQVELKHRDFRETVRAALKTDPRGAVELGSLPGIAWVRARGPQGTQQQWFLQADSHSKAPDIQTNLGTVVRIPYMGSSETPRREEFSLLEVRGGAFCRDFFEHIRLRQGYVEIEGLPAGDFSFVMKHRAAPLTVRVTAGVRRSGYALSPTRHLEETAPRPLQIESVRADARTVRIALQGAGALARVHVLATRFAGDPAARASLGRFGAAAPRRVGLPGIESLYVSGRRLGEELRYVLERQQGRIYPGNLLERPSLLLNPWAVRSTETGVDRARGGEAWERAVPATLPHMRGGRGGAFGGLRKGEAEAASATLPNLDFLPAPGLVLANLRAGEDGVITLDRADLGSHQELTIVAADWDDSVVRTVMLEEPQNVTHRDLRLRLGLDPERHYARQQQVSVVAKGGALALRDITTATFEVYDTLAKVYQLYATLSGNATLAEFRFLVEWPALEAAERRALYSRHACHELNFFLKKKDPAFFRAVVAPYLAHKKDKTFLDRVLLGQDVSFFRDPKAYSRLNALERILLGQAVAGEAPRAARHIRDRWQLVPPDLEREQRLFRVALQGSALETGDVYGLAAARKAEEAQLSDAARRPERGLAKPTASPARTRRAAKKKDGGPLDAPAEPEESIAVDAELAVGEDAASAPDAWGAKEVARRRRVRQLYRAPEKTQEYAENNYYHILEADVQPDRVPVNAFWRDYAAHCAAAPDRPFFSPHLAAATSSFTEMVMALAVLDLPFQAETHASQAEGAAFTLKAGSPLVAYHREIREAAVPETRPPLLVSQNIFRLDDRYAKVENERVEKYVHGELLTHVVYGCQVVLTNPTATRQKVEVLLQIPRGAMPVKGSLRTRTQYVQLEPYGIRALEYTFYFPAAGTFAHYPVHVAKNEAVVAYAAPRTFQVLDKPRTVDRSAWNWVSQHAAPEAVLQYLAEKNIEETDLGRIAWRMQERAYWQKVLAVLSERHRYDQTLWSYSLRHDDPARIREYLRHCDSFLNQCGAVLASPLVDIDPVERRAYQHFEYKPLVNARAHRLGVRRTILNDRLYSQYHALLKHLSYKADFSAADCLAVAYYLFLQDRIEQALSWYHRIDGAALSGLEEKLQYEYMTAYALLYEEKPAAARAVAARHVAHPVPRWRHRFAAVRAQVDEIEGAAPQVFDPEKRAEAQARLAATEPNVALAVESRQITLTVQNVDAVTLNFYRMDLELLFSRNPFMQARGGQFAFIQPNHAEVVPLPAGVATHTVPLPEAFHNANVMVEAVAGGVRRSQAYTANSLALQIVETYGQLRVAVADTDAPLAKVYVKVYARLDDGSAVFYKDGYTDLRGCFDYASLSTDDLDRVQRFALLLVSPNHGAVVREAAPPKR